MASYRSAINRLKRQARKAKRAQRKLERELKQSQRKLEQAARKYRREANKVHLECTCGKKANYHYQNIPKRCPGCGTAI